MVFNENFSLTMPCSRKLPDRIRWSPTVLNLFAISNNNTINGVRPQRVFPFKARNRVALPIANSDDS